MLFRLSPDIVAGVCVCVFAVFKPPGLLAPEEFFFSEDLPPTTLIIPGVIAFRKIDRSPPREFQRIWRYSHNLPQERANAKGHILCVAKVGTPDYVPQTHPSGVENLPTSLKVSRQYGEGGCWVFMAKGGGIFVSYLIYCIP